MADFTFHLRALIEGLDASKHRVEIETLSGCRSVRDLERIVDRGGWLTPGSRDPRIKLIRHMSGTYLVVRYEDGWTTRLAMEPFPK